MPDQKFQSVCIYGAGAIGGWIGARLAAQGAAVSLVARGATLTALQQQGLRLREGESERTYPARAVAEPAELGVQDLVVLAVKAPALADVARRIGPLLGPDTVVLTAMNGVPWWFFQGFGGALAGSRVMAVDPTGGPAGRAGDRRRSACQLRAGCPRCGAAPFWPRPDPG